MEPTRVLVLIDSITLPHLRTGEPPFAPFSHDKNLFQFAHESIRRGQKVYIASVQDDPYSRPYWEVTSVYPNWTQEIDPVDYANVRPDIIVAVFPEALNIRRAFPFPKIVAIHAAIHWVESPEIFEARYVFDLITAIRHNVDFIVTQNERMKDLLAMFYGFVARWRDADRILVAPLGIVPEEQRDGIDRAESRKKMGLKKNEIGIINSGGAWRWTDFNTFLEAFGATASADGGTPFKLFIMGLHQPQNKDHATYIEQTERILLKYREQVGRSIILETNWNGAGALAKQFTAGADLGLNVNQDSLENWQSYRLRFLDYMYFGVPVINTRGDTMADVLAQDAVFCASAGDVGAYRTILNDIRRNPGILENKAAAMRKLATKFDSRRTYGAVVEHIAATPRRSAGDLGHHGPCVLDYAEGRIRSEMGTRMENKVRRLAEWLRS
jgi:glycosyltransferase involved in cell wall biosynthesis